MKQLFAVGLAVLMVASLVTASMAQPKAQPQEQPAPKTEQLPKADKMESSVMGKIKNVDPSGSMVTLEDGTQLTIPESVKVSKAELKAGAMILARFEQKGGQKVVTSIEVKKGGS